MQTITITANEARQIAKAAETVYFERKAQGESQYEINFARDLTRFHELLDVKSVEHYATHTLIYSKPELEAILGGLYLNERQTEDSDLSRKLREAYDRC